VTALLLAALTVALIWPVPVVLARSRRALRHPGPALVAWQLVGLASGLAAIGALVASGVDSPLWIRWLSLGGAATLASYLLAVAVLVAVRTLRHRRRHRDLLDLVGRPAGRVASLPREALVIDSPTATAYCLPGLRSRLVVTSGALDTLSPPALAAVLAHESAHLAQRHDLVVLPFVAWQTALPFLPSARTARAAVALLVEALADDAARARIGARPLGEALVAVSLSGSADYRATPETEARLARL
jgi:Zn-dependent protease with chaperone function